VAALILIGSFAAWGVAHVLLVARLAGERPRWRAPVALLVLPLAPYWAARAGHRVRAVLWCVAALTWILARLLLAH
jgi:hypothetical protein